MPVIFRSRYPGSVREGQPAHVVRRLEGKVNTEGVAYVIKFANGHTLGVYPDEIGLAN